MIVAGIMSGTSADGINVALVRITGSRVPQLKLLTHHEFPYPKAVRHAVLAAMNSPRAKVADLARLNFLLAELYAEAVRKPERTSRTTAQLAGCHGQTLYHQGEVAPFLGRKLAVTWQIGDGSILAARLGIPVVTDFRPADIAAGGQGAPLVPYCDYLLYRHPRVGRIAQNIGGIANLTAIPANALPADVIAFDTGPGNMVIDAVAEQLLGIPYDRDGRAAARGAVLDSVLREMLRLPFFRRRPPKTAGREQFGREFVANLIRRCGKASKNDIVATATALTAQSITDGIRRFVVRRPRTYRDLIVSGGGASNPMLVAMLRNAVSPLGLQLRFSDEFGMPSQAKEAAAFALLAYQTWNHRPSNLPSATGAKRPAILGKISYA